MPAVSVLIWNIEEFGVWTDYKKGDAGEVLLGAQFRFIRHLLLTQEVDVLIIQEFREGGIAYLGTLAAMVGGWNYDYLPGSVVSEGMPKSIDDLKFYQTGNFEGYAVLWRNNVLTEVAPAADKISSGKDMDPANGGFISLVLMGKPVTFHIQEPNVRIEKGADLVRRGFPQSITPVISGDPSKDASIELWQHVRRPCYVHVKKGNGSVPVVVYHAPNGAVSSFYGALICGASGPLWSPDGGRTVVGGDFNITSQSQLETGFDTLTENGMANTTRVGGESPTVKYGYQRSMVHYVKKGTATILAPGNCLGSPRDELMIGQSLTGTEGTVLDVLELLGDATSALSKAVFCDADLRQQVIQTANLAEDHEFALPEILYSDPMLLSGLKQPFQPGTNDKDRAFGNQLLAAIFYRCFISDHLPVLARFDV